MAGITSCAMNFWAPERFPTFFQHKRYNSLPTHTRHTCAAVLRKPRVTRNILHYTTLTSKKPDQNSPVSFENQTNVTISIKQTPRHKILEIFLNLETFSKNFCVKYNHWLDGGMAVGFSCFSEDFQEWPVDEKASATSSLNRIATVLVLLEFTTVSVSFRCFNYFHHFKASIFAFS